MEIIKIGRDSFKISLDSNEAKKYELIESIRANDCMSTSIKVLLEALKEKSGIDFGKERVSAEVYISKDGGCEVFVSKMPEITPITKNNTKPRSRLIYRFETLEHLLMVCEGLKRACYDDKCDVYYNKNTNTYFLVMYGIYPKDIKYAFLCEYGTKLKSNLYIYIVEHCECIFSENAVEIFSKLL